MLSHEYMDMYLLIGKLETCKDKKKKNTNLTGSYFHNKKEQRLVKDRHTLTLSYKLHSWVIEANKGEVQLTHSKQVLCE